MKSKDDLDIIVAKELAAGYKDKIVWSDANFSIKRGEFIGLLGSNGAGKTTLFRLILGLANYQRGTINVFGSDPKRGNKRIGYVPQRRFIDTESKIDSIEYVRIGITGNKWGFSVGGQAGRERQAAMDILASLDASELANRPLSELSGGELQRVFLAQALIGKPDLLLLDEPLANLDIRRETQLIRLIHSVAKDQNIAVLLIAHDINPLLPVVDRIIYIANGKVASGRTGEIITSKRLSQLYGAPIEVLSDSKGRLAVLGVEEAIHHDA
ncbi:MAG: metal ABC transporter ATP-binding protein [Candidatus Saccharimonadales bacterium]